jgi:hypothetical protein
VCPCSFRLLPLRSLYALAVPLSRGHRPTYVTGLVVEKEVTTNYLLPQACTFTVYTKKQAAEIAAVFRR